MHGLWARDVGDVNCTQRICTIFQRIECWCFFLNSDMRICFFFTTDTNMSIVILRQNSVSKNRVFCLKLCKNIYETFKLEFLPDRESWISRRHPWFK